MLWTDRLVSTHPGRLDSPETSPAPVTTPQTSLINSIFISLAIFSSSRCAARQMLDMAMPRGRLL